jgi:hemerythrin-like domain-containing protein
MQSLNIIKSEHRNLAVVLHCLDKLVEQIDQHHKKPDFRTFHAIMHYIDAFLDTYHHPKENEHLFPALRRRSPDSQALLGELEKDHVEGERLATQMLKALSVYEFMGEPAFDTFRNSVKHYIQFEREHAMREEREVFPRAKDALLDSDWKQIDAKFAENNDPIFGVTPRKEFSALLELIANITPAPYGIGAEWKDASLKGER